MPNALLPFLQYKLQVVMGNSLGVITKISNDLYSYTVINISSVGVGMIYSEVQKHEITYDGNDIDYRSYHDTNAYIGAFTPSDTDDLIFTSFVTKQRYHSGIPKYIVEINLGLTFFSCVGPRGPMESGIPLEGPCVIW
jgi:hypothetical protein